MRFAGRLFLVLLTLILIALPDHTYANSANDPGVIPEFSAIDTSKMRVGTPVIIVYGLGIADPATGEWPRLVTATGTIQAINEQRLLLAQKGRDLPQRIELQRIKRLELLDPSDSLAEEAQGVTLYFPDHRVMGSMDEADQNETSTPERKDEGLKMMQGESGNAVQDSAFLSIADTLSVRIEDNKGALERISGKLGAGAAGASLLFWVGGMIGTRIDEYYGHCRGWFPINEQHASQEDSCADIAGFLGASTGWVLGASIGVSMVEPNDRFTHSLVGSLGGLVTCGLLTLISDGTLWPSMVAGPIVGSTVASEWSRHTGLSGKSDIAAGKARRFSIGLGSGPKGEIAGVLRLRF